MVPEYPNCWWGLKAALLTANGDTKTVQLVILHPYRWKDGSKNIWKCGNFTSLISPSLHKEWRANILSASGLFLSFCKSLKHDTLYCEWSPSPTLHMLEFIWLIVIEYLILLQYCVPRQITLKLKGTVRAINDVKFTVCLLHPSHFTTSHWGTTAALNFPSCSANLKQRLLEIVLDFCTLYQRPFNTGYDPAGWAQTMVLSVWTSLRHHSSVSFSCECLIIWKGSFYFLFTLWWLQMLTHCKPSLRFFESEALCAENVPVCCIYGLLPVLKAEQQFHLLDQSRQKLRETNNDLVNHF